MNKKETLNWVKKKTFFNDTTAVLYFLSLCLFFAIMKVVFGPHVGILEHTHGISPMHPQLQIAFTTISGLITVIISRFVLLWVSRKHTFSPAGYTLWLMVELIATIATAAFTLWEVSGKGPMMLTPLAADLLLALITIEAIPYIITILLCQLQQEHNNVLRLQDELDQLQPHQQATSSLAGDRIIHFHNKGNRLVFSIECKSILYIEAADNYTNIHYLNEGHEDTYILHNSLKELELLLSDTPLLRCHRGYMVNLDNVRRLQRDRAQLQLELNGSSKVVPVTKTYANQVTERLTNETK